MIRNNEKISSVRKYFNWFLFLIVIILLCFIMSKLYTVYRSNRLKESVLNRVVGTLQYDDLSNALPEFVSDDFIFISYTESDSVRDLEVKLKKIIVDNNLQDNFYYLKANDLMLEDNYIDSLNIKFKLKDSNKIIALPALLYYKNGKFVKTITSSEDAVMSIEDFSKLLDNYEVIERK